MTPPLPSPLQGVALLFILYFTILYYYRRKALLPPGPKGLPLIGNLFDVPKTQEWLAFIELSQKYDPDVISVDLMGDTVIVLNSLKACQDLLETKSSIYSDRPPFPMLNDLIGFDWHFAFMPYGAVWKRESFLHVDLQPYNIPSDYRKVFMQQFQPSQVLSHRPCELEAARVLLQRLLESPAKFERHLRHMAGMVILSTAYGIDVQPEDDPHIDISESALQAMSAAANRGSFLVDSLPFLKFLPEFLPGAGFKKKAREWHKPVSAMPIVPYDFVKEALVRKMTSLSISENYQGIEAEEQETVLRNVLGACYAGADTTVSALGTFILAMTMYPDVQQKAQSAVDNVVGHTRLPDFEDEMPYVDAVVREVLRWRPIVPLGVAHAVSEDDIYKGYHIPAGSVVVGNSWAVLHDEATFGPNTDQFIPERWLTEEGQINTSMQNPDAAFGFGRRICPGKDMAQWSIWICVASILATFNITKSLDKNGVPIEPSGEYTSGFLIYPVPHKCDIVPKNEAARGLIRNALHQ
ncbi:cytochrome P450 [Mycena crocata]|nr:cytochrome P450 [Mycena crocata]